MAKVVFFICICALFFNLSVQKSGYFDCEKLPKCNCEQKSDNLEQIPLFSVDCSRQDIKEVFTDNILPLYTGRLDLSHNKLTYLNESTKITSNTIYYLDLSYNKIQEISNNYFKNLTTLIYLNLGHNNLITIHNSLFTGLSNLKIMNLQSNKINTLSKDAFVTVTSLEDINLNNNDLGEVFEKNKLSNYLPNTLRSLYLEHIGLKNISRNMFEDMMRLKRLSIAYNSFSELPYLPLDKLEYLDISGTKISNLTTKSLSFPYLKILKMNRLPQIRKISDYTFFNLPNLEELSMEHCIKLEEMDPISFGHYQDKNSTNRLALKKFSVAYSGLKFLPDTFQYIFPDLKEIYLKGNFWECSCKIMWFTHFKKNVRDNEEVRCYSPKSQANKTIFSMTEEEFSCFGTKKIISTSGLPIQSWLFPLIGVLTIIIFILVAILIYMGPYGQNIYKMEGKMIGPESPYCPMTIYPNHAEDIKI